MSDYDSRINPTYLAQRDRNLPPPLPETATKYDRQDGKAPLSMIPRSALELEARVLEFGAKKYSKNNWKKGMEWTRLVDSALRHLTAWNEGEELDPESGLSHLAHAKCCLSFLIEYQTKGLGEDDR